VLGIRVGGGWRIAGTILPIAPEYAALLEPLSLRISLDRNARSFFAGTFHNRSWCPEIVRSVSDVIPERSDDSLMGIVTRATPRLDHRIPSADHRHLMERWRGGARTAVHGGW